MPRASCVRPVLALHIDALTHEYLPHDLIVEMEKLSVEVQTDVGEGAIYLFDLWCSEDLLDIVRSLNLLHESYRLQLTKGGA